MTYSEYLLTFQGYLRSYYNDIAKHRITAYQVWSAHNRGSIVKFMPLPIDDLSIFDPVKIRHVRSLFIAKLREEKENGKRS